MNTPLDHFESALLGELREHVATRSAPDVVTEPPRRHHYRRWATGLAVAATAATAFVVASPGGPGASPAYAVDQDADGDVVVTIHRLEDSAGLEDALRAKGIDATVSFDPMTDNGVSTFTVPDGEVGEAPEGGTFSREDQMDQEGPVTEARPAKPGEELDVPDCGGIDDTQPATLSHEGDDWVLRIPADSVLQDREVSITTGPGGTLGVFYAGNEPGSYCGVMSVGNVGSN